MFIIKNSNTLKVLKIITIVIILYDEIELFWLFGFH